MNINLFSKIKKQLRLHPLNFDMDSYVDAPPEHPCGCTLCIGGWALILHRCVTPEEFLKEVEVSSLNRTIQQEAAIALDVPVEETNALFYVTAWPHPFQREYECASTPEEQVEIACKRIDHFILTKE